MITAIKAWFMEYALILLGAVAVAGWVYGGVQTLHVSAAKRETAAAKQETVALQGRWDAQSLQRETQAREASEAARAQEAQRLADQRKALDDEALKTASARIDADLAHTALGRLQQRATAASASCNRGSATSDSAAASTGPAAGPTGDMQADLLGRVGAAAEQLAIYADIARIAGKTCQVSYDALRK